MVRTYTPTKDHVTPRKAQKIICDVALASKRDREELLKVYRVAIEQYNKVPQDTELAKAVTDIYKCLVLTNDKILKSTELMIKYLREAGKLDTENNDKGKGKGGGIKKSVPSFRELQNKDK